MRVWVCNLFVGCILVAFFFAAGGDVKKSQVEIESLVDEGVSLGDLLKKGPASTKEEKLEGAEQKSDSGSAGVAPVGETEASRSAAKQLELGALYRDGSNVTDIDLEVAFGHFLEAAKLGSVEGLFEVGLAYKTGDGVELDIEKGLKYLQVASDMGHPGAQRELSFMYSSGLGVERDEAMAVLLAHFAAKGGDLLAQMALGYRHMFGLGVPKSCPSAVLYYTPVAESVVQHVQESGGPPILERQRVAIDPPARVGVGEEDDVIQYYQYSAERGDTSAQVALGRLHYYGAKGLPRNGGKALHFFELAAAQGDGNAMSHLGNMYAHGISVPANNETALEYFRRAADMGNAAAQNGLGYMHMYGQGVSQSYSTALSYFAKASEQGNSEGRFNLAALHVGGHGVKKDYGKALYHFTIAANQGHLLALYNLAMMHRNGLGTPKSCPTALQFLKGVAERGPVGGSLQDGYKLWAKGDYSGAIVKYLAAAEVGYEVAQSNLATIFDRFGDSVEDLPMQLPDQTSALLWFGRAAEQNNVDAYLRMGDYHYYGLGTPVNLAKAAANYRLAGDVRNAQALFNLGYMHHHGLGIPQDHHLAKRYYDMAGETTKDAQIPVMLALWALWLDDTIATIMTTVDREGPRLAVKFGLPLPPPSSVWLPLLQAYWDVVLATVLVGILSIVLSVRAARLRPRRS